jgi:AraC-like DNA-binding protein
MNTKQPEIFIGKLINLMETQQFFLIPSLRAEEVAKEMGIGYQKFAALLNTQLKNNFNDFINGYRIRYACSLMKEGKDNQRTRLAEIAKESGFTSRSVFYEAFRKEMGITPGDYISKMPTRQSE